MDTNFKFNGYEFVDNDTFKRIIGKDFHLFFDKKTGYTERWGKDKNDNPIRCELGPTIIDIELSRDILESELYRYKNEILLENHTCLGKCPMCYKSNGKSKFSHIMSLKKFKEVIMQVANTHVKWNDTLIPFNTIIIEDDKKIQVINSKKISWETDICNCSPVLQIACGLTNIDANPEIIEICEFAVKIGIIPNITVHGKDEVSDEFLSKLCLLCGNLAVSRYNPNETYNFIERLYKCGAKQINMHLLVSEETKDAVIIAFKDMVNDKRLKNLSTAVLLFLKDKGRGCNYHKISQKHAFDIFDFAVKYDIPFGFDICCSHIFDRYIIQSGIKNHPEVYDHCDSGLFSGYVNTLGEFCPCSFVENDGEWKYGEDVFKCKNFISEIWNGKKLDMYRMTLLGECQNCLYYEI
jgi:hypothetical protein